MPKWVKLCLAIVLLPVCLGASRALFWVLRAGIDSSARGSAADLVWVPLVAGAACWVVIYVLLPKPMWIYVFGHELTHALWVWVFEGKVKRFVVSSRGGHVEVTKTNFLIALAPYFFPLYALLVVAAYCLGLVFWNWSAYRLWFLLLLGAAYAFHVTLTWHALKTEQTDITSQGYIFSTVVIWLGNVGFLLFGLPLLLGVPLQRVGAEFLWGTWEVVQALCRWVGILHV